LGAGQSEPQGGEEAQDWLRRFNLSENSFRSGLPRMRRPLRKRANVAPRALCRQAA
jgi:hypothetical protein